MQISSLKSLIPWSLSRQNKSVPLIMQYSATECGVASLAMVFAYYNYPVSIESLRDKCGISRDGCSAKTLLNVARGYHFQADAYRMEWDDIKRLSRPVIAYWNFNHYVVLQIIGDKLKVYDPEMGCLQLGRANFDKCYTGVVLDIYPTSLSCIPILKDRDDVVKTLFSGFNKELLYLYLTVACLAIIILSNSFLSRILIDHIISRQIYSWLFGFIFLMGLANFMHAVLIIIRKNTEFKFISKLFFIKANAVIDRLIKFPMVFYSVRHRGDMISALSRLEILLNNSLNGKLSININVILSVFILIFMAFCNLQLTVISLGVMAFYFSILLLVNKAIINEEVAGVRDHGRFYTSVLTNINNIETIKSSGYENEAFDRWQSMFCKKSDVMLRKSKLEIVLDESKYIYHLLLNLTSLFFGIRLVIAGQMTVGILLAYYAASLIFSEKIVVIFSAYKSCKMANASRGRLNDIINYDISPRFLHNNDQKINFNCQFVFEIKSLSFGYNPQVDCIFRGMNLSIASGEQLVLAGSSGCGKSTLARLLAGLYHASIGSVHLFGNNINNYPASQLSQLIAYVPQEASLFSGTLLDNIILFRVYDERLLKLAISIACLDGLVSERGLLAEVEEGGGNFSGGERQRIDIARAVYQNTPILILDEATSALDSQTQYQVINNLSSLKKTIVYVAHRLSAFSHCRIVNMDNERLIHDVGWKDLIC